MKTSRIFFPKRIPEPEEMERIENSVFHKVAKQNTALWFIPLTDHLFELVQLREGTILDVACGHGLLTRELAKRFPKMRIVGIDISPQVIKFAKHNCKRFKNVTLKIASVNQLPFADNSFDLVVCRDSFHHFHQPYRAFCEIKRVVKEDHLIYVQDLRRDLPMYLLRIALPRKTVFQKLQYYSVRAAYTKDEVVTLLHKVGLHQLRVFTRKITSKVKAQCAKRNLRRELLRRSFQAHYVAIVQK